MATALQAVRGMNDVLPDEARAVAAVRGHRARRCSRATATGTCARRSSSRRALFVRGIGEVTDIVEKEMYSFDDTLNGDSLTLRPEATAGIVRAAIEHNLLYDGPLRAVDRRARCSATSARRRAATASSTSSTSRRSASPGPDVDAEQIVMLRAAVAARSGLAGRRARDQLDRRRRRARARTATTLIAHFEQHADALDDDAQAPPAHQSAAHPRQQESGAAGRSIDGAPRLIDYLGDDVARALRRRAARCSTTPGIAYAVNPRLVRGLDYYNRTVFEWVTDALGAQGTVCGGGRYDGLFEQLGGKPTPACGFAMGVERLILLLRSARPRRTPPRRDAYVVHAGERAARSRAASPRRCATPARAVVLHAGGGSFKSQMKKADASGARSR